MSVWSSYADDMNILSNIVSTTSFGYSADDGANFLAYKDVIVDAMGNPALYLLDSSISRQEMLKIVVNISGWLTNVDYMWEFNDVKSADWVAPYIETALKKWIISNTVLFRPNDKVTESETLKMILRARGIEKITGYPNWYTGYNIRAKNIGLIDSDISPNMNAVRGFIFHVAARTYSDFSNSAYGTNEEEGVMVGTIKMLGSKSIYSNLNLSSSFSTFLTLIEDAGLTEGITNVWPITVFVPTNSAFWKLSAQTLVDLQKPENKSTLINVFKDHIVSGYHSINDLSDETTLKTLSGKSLYITKSGDNFLINWKYIIQTANIKSANGIIQIVDTVLAP
jgi:uncharacterized surface protein with fasciclin (FAS1) repeats